jgi:glycosyltransferase involved in cell wall biosynthesis
VVGAAESPAVTVIIPTYNWSTVLPYSIGSVLDQTFTDFELLVIGDRCTDDSADVVGRIDDPRVRWVNLDVRTSHQSGPNNKGIDLARGSAIAYLGHDDLWLPHHLETLVPLVRNGAGMAYGKTVSVLPDERPQVIPPKWWPYQRGIWIPPTAVVHSRDIALAAGGWRPPTDTGLLDPEADLWRRIAAHGAAPKLVPRLTNVKFPASRRRDVYRERPSREQALWLTCIRGVDDPEQALAAASMRESPAAIVRAVRGRLLIRTRLGLRRGGPTVTAAQRASQNRRYKGVEG